MTKLTETQWIALLESNPEKFGSYDVHLLEKAILDCYGRFLLNLPGELLKDHVHLQFQIQVAETENNYF